MLEKKAATVARYSSENEMLFCRYYRTTIKIIKCFPSSTERGTSNLTGCIGYERA